MPVSVISDGAFGVRTMADMRASVITALHNHRRIFSSFPRLLIAPYSLRRFSAGTGVSSPSFPTSGISNPSLPVDMRQQHLISTKIANQYYLLKDSDLQVHCTSCAYLFDQDEK
jgi:hypothetical protein